MSEKPGRPTDAKQDEWDRDLHPNQQKVGRNVAFANDTTTAYEIKDLHNLLQGYTDDELKQIPVLPTGTRLEQGSTYIDLNESEHHEFTAMANMEAGDNNYYVPKTEVGYQLWNRLIGVQNPERLGTGNES